jgi:hypothetical protein
MAGHSSGVSLRNRASGPNRYRDEAKADGGKRRLRRRVRYIERARWRREVRAA